VTLIFLVIALLPGAIAWWSSRGLEKLKDDPALPELLFARHSRISGATWFAIIATAFADDELFRFGLFMLSVASPFAGGYPLARKLFGHTISFPGYLWQGLKALVAGLGPWIVLIYAPGIVTSTVGPWRLAVLLLVPVMIAWSYWFPQVWLALNDARPVTNPALTARIDEIASRASVKPPALFVFGSDRMKIVNAVALRGPRPSVALGNGLVDLLEPDEVGAIYAHEIAHIEQIPPREMRAWRLATWAVIVAGFAGFYLAAERLSAGTITLLSSVWPLLILGMLILQGRRSKRHETESDLRAAELTGDPELVARALVKVHVHGLIPRRWSIDFEKSASHPSLARRIQALRGTSISAPAEARPTVIQTARPSRVVAFDASRAYWFEGVPEGTQRELNSLREQASGMRSASWNDLVELRIAAETEEDRALVATHKSGDTWSVPIAKSDVAAVQKLLDSVDTRLYGGLHKRRALSPRLLLSVTTLVTLFTSPGLLLLPLIVAIFRPSTAILAGMAGLTAVDAVFRVKASMGLPMYWGLLSPGISLVLAALLIIAARQRARGEKRDGLQFTVILLGLAATVMLLATGTSLGGGLAGITRNPSLRPLAACLVGLGAALLVAGRRQARVGGTVALAVGSAVVVLAIAGPAAAGGNFSSDPATLREVRRVEFPAAMITRLEPSPDGRGILVEVAGGDDDGGRAGEWQLRYGDSLWTMPVVGAGFVDSARVLSLWPSGDSLELRLERLDTTAVEWVMPLPALRNASLTTRPSDRSWAVVGEASHSDSLVLVSGALDSADSPLFQLAGVDSMLPSVFVPGPGGRSVVGVRFNFAGARSLVTSLLFRRGLETEMWESSERGVRRIGTIDGIPSCGESGSAAVRCVTINAGQITFWRFSGDTVQKEAALVGGQYYRTDLGKTGLVTMLNIDATEAQFGDPAKLRLLRATLPAGDGTVHSATASPGRLWVATRSGRKILVIEYRVERAP
jgi:heat shock protein HtpX